MTEQISNLENQQPQSAHEHQLAELAVRLNAIGDDETKLAEKNKILAKIVKIQEKMKLEQREREKIWTYEMFVNWAREEVGEDDPEKWLEENFDLEDLEAPRVKVDLLELNLDKLQRFPANARVNNLNLIGKTKS